MGRITLDESRDGLDGFPQEYRVVGRDDSGDVLAVDAKGKVRCFAHGAGHWAAHTPAFATEARMREHIAFQDAFDAPPDAADLAALRTRKAAIRQFLKGRRDAPYSRRDADLALEELRVAIELARFSASKQGQTQAATQAIGLQCDQALRAAGAPGTWFCRALVDDPATLGIAGPFTPPWTTERIAELLRPIVGARRMKFLASPQPKA
jgi:hypothetical protein